jgi:DNA-binding beta-propeller fold protein YncE
MIREMSMRHGWMGLLLVCVSVVSARAGDVREQSQFRRPVSAAVLSDGRLAVANRDSGSLSLIDAIDWSVVAEEPLGRRLSDVAAVPQSNAVIVLDEEAGEAVVVEIAADQVVVRQRVSVARSPVSVCLLADVRTAAIASLWSHALVLCDLDPAALQIAPRPTIELPFAPRHQVPLPDGERIVVADAFGGRLAIVNAVSGELETVRHFPGHNIRGLAVSPNGRDLYVAHQLLDSHAPTTFDSIHWGNLIENLIRVVPLTSLLDEQSDLVEAGRVIQLGSTGGGAGDPAGLAFVAPDRMIAVASGIDRAQVFPILHGIVAPAIVTGRMPTAVTVLPDRDIAVVVNTLGDSLSVIDTSNGKLVREVSLGPSPEPGPRERGESLFFDADLSHDGWLSCHSCHTDGHANGLLADTSGDGTFGTPKRILSLLGTRDNNPWAWNGSLRTLHEQTAQSVASSMHGELPAAQINDLVTFLHSLAPPPPLKPVATSAGDDALLTRGREIFNSRGCAHCHVPPLTFTSDQIVEVGLADEQGATKFNPPSLRGVSQQERFFHDGRAATLRSVFEDYGHQLPEGLPPGELDALVRYLQSL